MSGGAYDSGATLKALTKFGNDYGSTKANESYNRFNTDQGNKYNRLAGVSGAGQQAVNQVGAQGMSAAAQTGELQTQAADARATGIVSGNNAWTDAMSGGLDAYNNYRKRNSLKALTSQGYGGDYNYLGSLERDR